jgi:hypothetical protein
VHNIYTHKALNNATSLPARRACRQWSTHKNTTYIDILTNCRSNTHNALPAKGTQREWIQKREMLSSKYLFNEWMTTTRKTLGCQLLLIKASLFQLGNILFACDTQFWKLGNSWCSGEGGPLHNKLYLKRKYVCAKVILMQYQKWACLRSFCLVFESVGWGVTAKFSRLRSGRWQVKLSCA